MELDSRWKTFLQSLAHLVGLERTGEEADRRLLKRFASSQDQGAFATLVWRHGAMVHGVCRRILRNEADAEDAFQAVFLRLAQHAGLESWQESIANWLYQTAKNVATTLRRSEESRRRRETTVGKVKSAQSSESHLSKEDLGDILDTEMQRLSEPYRAPLILCYLEGLKNQEAARRLGLSRRTFERRLNCGRELLRAYLARRGIVFSSALLASGLMHESARAATLSPTMASATVNACAQTAAGESLAGLVSPTVLSLVPTAAPAATAAVSAKSWSLLALVISSGVVVGGGAWGVHEWSKGRSDSSPATLPPVVQPAPSARAAEKPEPLPALPMPLAAYSFDERDGAIVRDAGALPAAPGTIVGKVKRIAGPGGAPAVEFDGKQGFIDLGNPDKLNFAGPITLAAWIRPEKLTSFRNIIGHGGKSDPVPEVYLRIAGIGEYQAGSSPGDKANRAVWLVPPGDVHSWVHVAGVYDGAAWRLYRNGTLAATKTTPQGALPSPRAWAIGAGGVQEDRRCFQGAIADVRIYNVALSAAQINQLASGPKRQGGPALPASPR